MSTDHDLLVISKFKNSRLYRILQTKKLREWAEITQVSIGGLCGYASLTKSPFRNSSTQNRKCSGYRDALPIHEFLPSALRIAFAMSVTPEWLFPVDLYSLHLPRQVEREYDSSTILTLQSAAAHNLLPSPAPLEDHVSARELRQSLLVQLSQMRPREEAIIKMRFGLDGKGERTLDELAAIFGVHRNRIQQIEIRVLRILRHPSHSKHLKEFFYGLHGDDKQSPSQEFRQ